MSSKFTFYAWEKSPHTAHEKLVLLKLADIANHDGIVAFELKEIAKACLIEEYKLANLLTSIVNQGFLDKSHVEKRAGREVHVFKLLLTDTLDLKVMTPAEMTKTTPRPENLD